VQRCVDNLVKNAVEAAPRDTPVTVAVAEDGPAVTLRVHNSGPPIPPDVLATLFHPFSTFGKRGGTGLGLFGVKLTVEALGGTVTHETGVTGTAFTIRFPGDATG
jgi:signal transduction histidine kinase